MSFYNKKSTLLPVIITPDVWQFAVAFPADPLRVEKRLNELLLAVLLTMRTAGPARVCVPDGSSGALPRRLTTIRPPPVRYRPWYENRGRKHPMEWHSAAFFLSAFFRRINAFINKPSYFCLFLSFLCEGNQRIRL